MADIGLEMCEISINFEKQNDFVWMVKPIVACKVLSIGKIGIGIKSYHSLTSLTPGKQGT